MIAAGPTVDLPVVSVWGRRGGEIGRVETASEGVVEASGLEDRPLLRPGEIAEAVPGLAATQHSGGGKANQYFLRGFNLDHGTDFSAFLDGAPLNLRTNAHGQGYLDLNPLTPELVQRISYRKGTYFADVGDFSAAGTVRLELFDTLPDNFMQVQAGEHNFARLAAAVALPGVAWIGGELDGEDGPWDKAANLRRASLILHADLGDWRLTGLAYGARWNSSDQIPARAATAGLISRFGEIDPSDGGRSDRFILSARRTDANSETVAYVQNYTLNLWSNFTYFLHDPLHGDQFEQAERRWILGGATQRRWRTGLGLELSAGLEGRYDAIGRIGLYQTEQRRWLSTDRADRVGEGSAAAWTTLAGALGPLRATVGLRGETMAADVQSLTTPAHGWRSATLLAPKATLAWSLSREVEVYADYGRGFHSNDARGAVASTAPAPLMVPGVGGETGVRYEQDGLALSASLWTLRLKSELVYSGDAGDTESSSASIRTGLELLANWTPWRGLNLEAAGGWTRARYHDLASGGPRIPNALDYMLGGGVTWRPDRRWVVAMTVRRLGPAALLADNSARARPSTLANLEVGRSLGSVKISLEVLNLLDSRDADIAYAYASRLPGEPAAGVQDLHFHSFEPRQLRIGLKRSF